MTWLRVDDQLPFAASTIAAGFGLYVGSDNILRAYVSSTAPGVRAFVWLMASGRFPSY